MLQWRGGWNKRQSRKDGRQKKVREAGVMEGLKEHEERGEAKEKEGDERQQVNKQEMKERRVNTEGKRGVGGKWGDQSPMVHGVNTEKSRWPGTKALHPHASSPSPFATNISVTHILSLLSTRSQFITSFHISAF